MHLRIIGIMVAVILGVGLSPIVTFACGRSNIPRDLSQRPQRIQITDWLGKYSFSEQVSSKPVSSDVNYTIKISATRCGGVFSRMTINGDLRSVDFLSEVFAIDANTIGLYFLADQSKVRSLKSQFKPGDLLLRIQREIPYNSSPSIPVEPIYHVYFESLDPVVPSHKSKPLEMFDRKTMRRGQDFGSESGRSSLPRFLKQS
jgi:Family of unknown function (DUF5991)